MSQFLAGISEVCFASSYGVALALEISRLFVRSGVRGAVMLGFAAAGLLAHTLFLGYQAGMAPGAPLSSAYHWYLVVAWILAVAYLYLIYYQPQASIGLFVLPLVLGLVAAAHFWADAEPFPTTRASLVWGIAHGLLLLVGTVAVLFGFATGLMYLLHAYRLKHKAPPRMGLRLPSLEWLERANRRSLLVAVPMLGAGLLSGTILNAVNRSRQVDQIPWSDPIVWASGLAFSGLIAVAAFNWLYKPARQGHKVAYLTIGCFGLLVSAMAASFFLDTKHRGTEANEPAIDSVARPEAAS